MAVVSPRVAKSRMLPSFVSKPPVEKEIVRHRHSKGTLTDASRKMARVDCHNASRSTYNVTNQLLYSKMHGRCPLLASMGMNGFSYGQVRFNVFVCNFHKQDVGL